MERPRDRAERDEIVARSAVFGLSRSAVHRFHLFKVDSHGCLALFRRPVCEIIECLAEEDFVLPDAVAESRYRQVSVDISG